MMAGFLTAAASAVVVVVVAVVGASAVFSGMVYDAYGHGIGAETLAPQDLGDGQAFIQVNAANIVEDPDVDQQFTFQMMDVETGEPVREVTYEIEASKQGDVLFHETFESGSGMLVIDLAEDEEAGRAEVEKRGPGLFGLVFGGADTARITGPAFGYGGLYQFVIRIHTAGGFSDRVYPPLEWNAGISVADTVRYTIRDVNFGKQDLYHTTYYDLVEGFEYDQQTGKVYFEMPFDGSLDSIDQTPVVHQEVAFSKEFGDLMVSNVSATINGALMPEGVVQIDDFGEEQRIIHLTVIKPNLLELYDRGLLRGDRLSFVVGPAEENLPLSTVTKNGQFRIIMSTTPHEVVSGQEVNITCKIMDVFLKDRPVEIMYDLRTTQNGETLGSRSTGTDANGEGACPGRLVWHDYMGVVYIHFENLGGNPLASAKLPIVINRISLGEGGAGAGPAAGIPGWVRSNAGWWAEGLISDGEFVGGMEFLISRDIIDISRPAIPDDPLQEIPEWVRIRADWWSKGLISDKEFVGGIEFLMSGGVRHQQFYS